MSLPLVKRRLDGNKFVARRSYPEVGADDGVEYVMDVVVSGRKVALIVARDEESGPAPYEILRFFAYEVVDSEMPAITVDGQWMPTVWQFTLAEGDQVAEWDRLQRDYDDHDDSAPVLARQMLDDMAKPASPSLTSFEFVMWRANDASEGWLPAGVILAKPDRSGVVAVPFFGFEDEALAWSDRFERVSPDILAELPTYAGRDRDIGPITTVKAPSFEEAFDRAKYMFAKEHYADTGRSLY